MIWYKDVKEKNIKFKKNILREVIFGMRTPKETKKNIVDLIHEIYINKGVNVEINYAKQMQNNYKIIISNSD